MSNKSQQKPTFILISNHRLIRLQLQFKIRWHHQSLGCLQAAAAAPVEEAPGIPWGWMRGGSELCQGAGLLTHSRGDDLKGCKPLHLKRKKGAQGKLPQAPSFHLVNSLGPGRCISSLD